LAKKFSLSEMKKYLVLFSFSVIFSASWGQSAVLENYIQMGLSSNEALKQENLEVEKVMKSIEIARSNLFPRLTFNPNYTLAAGGRRLEFPIGDLLNPVYGTLNKLTQSNNFPQVENVSQLLAPNNFHDTKFSFQYPLFNADIKANLALQKELLESSHAKKRAVEFELKHQIEIAYFQYLQAEEAIHIYEEALAVSQQFVDLNEKLVENKVILKDALLSSQYEATKLRYQIELAIKNKDLAIAYFNFLINRPLEDPIVKDNEIVKTLPNVPPIATSLAQALVNRPEFSQLQSGLRVHTASIALQEKNAKLPQLFLGGAMGFQGYGYTFADQAYGVFQLGLNWELFHGYEKKKKIEQAHIARAITESKLEEAKRSVGLQVFQSHKELQNAFSNYESVKGGIEKTQKIMEIVNSRYKNGTALGVEVAKAQADLLTAKLAEVLAKYEVWSKFAELKKTSAF
jgi:outer membrane protein